jgi:hypothetical protein
MADNIQIVGNILSETTVTRYSVEDSNLISSKEVQENFGGTNYYIEYFVYDVGGNLLSSNYNYLDYKLPSNIGLTPGTSTPSNTTGNIQTNNVGIISTLSTPTSSLFPVIEIDPIMDIQNIGYSSGEFKVRYNFFQNKLSNYADRALFIKEISTDRTEIRLASTTLSNDEITSVAQSLIDEINNADYYIDFLLNLGNNEQYVAVNVALNTTAAGSEILFKLYHPLPPTVKTKTSLWIVEEKVDPYLFDINLDKLITLPSAPALRGPNFDITIDDQNTISTSYNNYNGLIANLQSLQSSSYQNILNLLTSQSININVDYSNYNNFVFFGSAKQRLANFYSKVQQIESYNNIVASYNIKVNTVPSVQTEINTYSSSINNIISQFDGYERHLYFNSGSTSWPKSGSIKPYTLLSVNSTSSINWFTTQSISASNYDLNNINNLEYAVPAFIKDDTQNQPFLLFLNMTGHYFDNIWIYLKSVTDLNLANNNLYQGISRDLVYERLKSLGIKLYNSKAGEAVNSYYLGANSGSATFDNNFTVTGSYLNNVPRRDLVAELYKRIYHNLPYLLKTKGTVAGLQVLITTFGITGSILTINEYGGGTKAELLPGFNTDKVRIINNPIATGSYSGNFILSSELSLQSYPTASSVIRDIDMNYVDISFSPETQIDTYISKSIASNNPSWNIDNYIGDPRQKYSGSYTDLNTQKALYYQVGTPGYPGFTGSLMDYNGFIRLIQYFDNSLFKMLEDFVPERTSLSTGVTINSPVLERNKVAYARPNYSTNITSNNGKITSSSISVPSSNFYNALTGSKKEYYTGEFKGSEVNLYATYFIPANRNPYLTLNNASSSQWDVYNASVLPTQSINLNTFLHSDFNVMLNNVSKSVASLKRYKIEYIYGTTSSILTKAELQDSYLYLKSYNISRYEGSKTVSLTYNNYTSGSYTGSDGFTILQGDQSYGKTAAIDHNSIKIGYFTEITANRFLPGRNNAVLKYLVDINGNFTELNQRNKHWPELQNTFKSTTTSSVSLFNNQLYSNQKATDGQKSIYNSGYNYGPIFYCGPTGSDNTASFQNLVGASAWTANAKNTLTPYYISGSGAGLDQYPLNGGYVYNIFNNLVNPEAATYFHPGTINSGAYSINYFPTYSVKETGNYSINASLPFTISTPGNLSETWTLQVWVTGSTRNTMIAEDSHIFNTIPPPGIAVSVQFANTAAGSCSAPFNNVYTNDGTVITGKTLYYDNYLTIPFTNAYGGKIFVNNGTSTYNYNTGSGVVGGFTISC